MTPDSPDHRLLDLVERGHYALAAAPVERVHAALTVLPELVSALDRVCQDRHEYRQLRLDLTRAVREFREAVWDVQRQHLHVTYNAAAVQRALDRVNRLLLQLDEVLQRP